MASAHDDTGSTSGPRHLILERLISASFGAFLTTLSGEHTDRCKEKQLTECIVTPLDVVKVRMQVPQSGYRSTSDALLRIVRNEGLISLYRGFVPTMAMSLPGTVVYFVVYERVRDVLTGLAKEHEKTAIKRASHKEPANEGLFSALLVPLSAGASARVFAATVVSPLELLRTRMQFQGRDLGRLKVVAGDLFREIRVKGLVPLWRGLSLTLWRDVPFSAVYWLILENLRTRHMRRIAAEAENTLHARGRSGLISSNTLSSFGHGAVAGAVAAVLTTPFDVAKTRQQIQRLAHDSAKTSTWRTLRLIVAKEGWRALFSGVVPRVGKVAPACAIMIGSYEFGKSYLRRYLE
jgi:solute carrier family 25 protein 39/40